MTRAQKAAETRARNKEAAARIAKVKAEAQAVVATGKCPSCSLPLQRNPALSGWWQCAAYGAPGFRPRGLEAASPCSFQCFTS